jgi:hypothetical protein
VSWLRIGDRPPGDSEVFQIEVLVSYILSKASISQVGLLWLSTSNATDGGLSTFEGGDGYDQVACRGCLRSCCTQYLVVSVMNMGSIV